LRECSDDVLAQSFDPSRLRYASGADRLVSGRSDCAALRLFKGRKCQQGRLQKCGRCNCARYADDEHNDQEDHDNHNTPLRLHQGRKFQQDGVSYRRQGISNRKNSRRSHENDDHVCNDDRLHQILQQASGGLSYHLFNNTCENQCGPGSKANRGSHDIDR
jgi:hypothetical protein